MPDDQTLDPLPDPPAHSLNLEQSRDEQEAALEPQSTPGDAER